MSHFDKQYRALVEHVIENGVWQSDESVRAHWKDGTPAKAIAVFDERIVVPAGTVPVLTTKEFKDLNALLELEWIWVKKSNVVQDLRDAGCGIWNEWENKDPNSKWYGTIGPAYGYVLGQPYRKFPIEKVALNHLNPKRLYTTVVENGKEYVKLDQVDYLIQSLLLTKESRRLVTSLWDLQHLDEMMLEPCVWNTTWVVIGNVLNLKVGIRSNDLALGNPFNAYQYFVLHRMIAQVVGIPAGEIVFSIDNAHVYDRHILELSNQFAQPELGEPNFWMNPKIKNFYTFNMREDIKMTLPAGSQPPKKIKFEISV